MHTASEFWKLTTNLIIGRFSNSQKLLIVFFLEVQIRIADLITWNNQLTLSLLGSMTQDSFSVLSTTRTIGQEPHHFIHQPQNLAFFCMTSAAVMAPHLSVYFTPPFRDLLASTTKISVWTLHTLLESLWTWMPRLHLWKELYLFNRLPSIQNTPLSFLDF